MATEIGYNVVMVRAIIIEKIQKGRTVKYKSKLHLAIASLLAIILSEMRISSILVGLLIIIVTLNENGLAYSL